ncbi:hypothetical protein [Phaffia rhodozyma]|uniref:Uncharacterized protein n=1 Tax=Phaffia rhodozyma TaxID=264483 RepID=A0A0F7SS88_PHARH|nr:hypothetical protein [Phaffia rhodozyma]
MLTLSICCIVLLPGGAICAVQAAPTGTTNENGKRFALPSGSVCSYQCPTLSSIPDDSDQRTSYPPDGITGAPYGTTGTTCTYNYKRTVPAACLYTRSTSVLNSSSSSNLACPSTLTSSGDCPASATYSGTPVKLLSWTATTKYKTCNFPGDTYDASGTCSYTNSNG